jgi:hypothetical protein
LLTFLKQRSMQPGTSSNNFGGVSFKHFLIKAITVAIAREPKMQICHRFFALRPISALDVLVYMGNNETGEDRFVCVRNVHLSSFEALARTIARSFPARRQDVTAAIIFSDNHQDSLIFGRGIARLRAVPAVYSISALREEVKPSGRIPALTRVRTCASISISLDAEIIDLIGLTGLNHFLESLKAQLEVRFQDLDAEL